MNASPPLTAAAPILGVRDAMADWSHVGSDLVFEGTDDALPVATIAIPTYRRAHLLVDAVRSALAQDFGRPFEVIVVDNDPASHGAAELLAAVPSIAERNVRYFVNRENFGMFGNFNRAIELARGEWMTILNDDDLLDPNWLTAMFDALRQNSRIDAIVSRKRHVRMGEFEAPSRNPRARLRSAAVQAVRTPLYALHFAGQSTRRLHARHFFWGPVAGTPLGLLYRTRCARELGGYHPEEFPASDQWFFARLADRYHLRQHRMRLASVRILENESANPETVVKSLGSVSRLQHSVAGNQAPRWWLRFAPLVLARLRGATRQAFGTDVPAARIEEALGVKVGKDRPLLLSLVRLLCGGWHPDPA